MVVLLPNKPNSIKPKSGIELEISEAVALVRGEAPMQGIAKLKELEARFPENKELNYHLGVFSTVTGQYDKAVPRLVKVIEEQQYQDANVYLYQCYLGLGQNSEAQEILEKAMNGVFSKEVNERIIQNN